jgi:hypothetical protein
VRETFPQALSKSRCLTLNLSQMGVSMALGVVNAKWPNGSPENDIFLIIK